MAINYSEETGYLNHLQDQLLQEAARLRGQVEDLSDGFYDSMKYLWENRSDMDSMEIFSNRQSIDRLVNSGEFTAKQLERIEKMPDSPYIR